MSLDSHHDLMAVSSPALLEARGLVKRYGGLVATNQIDLSLAAGEVCGIIGPNGAGKSTLIGLLSGALHPTEGRILFEGRDLTGVPAPGWARNGIARTYQIPRPFLDMTVEENLQVSQFSIAPFQPGGTARDERRNLLRRCGLADCAHLPARALPLLRRKRLEVARALALKPKILLLDEVGAGLIDSEVTELIALIRSVATPERAIVIIEHVIRVVKECCNRVVVIDFGRKIAEGRTADVLVRDDVAAVYLGTSHHEGGQARANAVLHRNGAETTQASFDRLVGDAVRSPGRGELGLRLEGIRAGYGQAKILHGIDLAVKPGEAVAILGTNGAGKTTLAATIAGSLRPTYGRLFFDGTDMTATPAHRRAGLGLAHCMEGRRIFAPLSVEENLVIAARGLTGDERGARLAQIYDLFPDLKDRRTSPGTAMSGGQQQMLAIGRALMSRPRFVIFDEISLGLAPVMMDRLYDALHQLKRAGLTMLIIEQDVDRALALADRVQVLERGRFALSGTAEQVRSDPRLREIYIGGSKR